MSAKRDDRPRSTDRTCADHAGGWNQKGPLLSGPRRQKFVMKCKPRHESPRGGHTGGRMKKKGPAVKLPPPAKIRDEMQAPARVVLRPFDQILDSGKARCSGREPDAALARRSASAHLFPASDSRNPK